ncbi:ATP-binding protein [uncultured Nocardioides sp.]|uniref:sensor histidine kinase n=1 Tax=uncultured Nocardioides sp. TaxID=198441 RepID=UPI002638B363|nr:ATP-binding protein [uncultured Nocardioides sp.]
MTDGGGGPRTLPRSPQGGPTSLDDVADGDLDDPVLRRRAFLACAWLAALSMVYAVLFLGGWLLLDNRRLAGVAVLAVVGGAVDLLCARLVLAGRLQAGVLLFAVNVLGVICAISLLVPEEVITVVVASMLPVVFTMQFVAGWPARLIAVAGLAVALVAMVGSHGLGRSSGLDPEVLAWVDTGGGMLALVGLVVLFAQARGVLETRTRLLIDSRREAEERRVGLEVARRSAALQDEFVNLVSHELRTPLSSILGYTELVLDQVADRADRADRADQADHADHADHGAAPDPQRRMLEVVLANAHRLDTLVADLLDVARLEPGTLRIEVEPLDVVALVGDVASAVAPLVSGKDQTLAVSSSAASVPLVGDPRRLEQVVTNLVSNAHKYSPPRSTIDVTVGLDGSEVTIAVRDRGIGMTTAELDQLFTKFFRADRASVRDTPGTGLGLVITRSIVELHGGRVGVESELGAGSTFTVHLPLDPEAAAAG